MGDSRLSLVSAVGTRRESAGSGRGRGGLLCCVIIVGGVHGRAALIRTLVNLTG